MSEKESKRLRKHMREESEKIIDEFLEDVKSQPFIFRFLIAINILFALDKKLELEEKK